MIGRVVICVVVVVALAAPKPGRWTVDGPREVVPPDWRDRDIIITRMMGRTTKEERGWNVVVDG